MSPSVGARCTHAQICLAGRYMSVCLSVCLFSLHVVGMVYTLMPRVWASLQRLFKPCGLLLKAVWSAVEKVDSTAKMIFEKLHLEVVYDLAQLWFLYRFRPRIPEDWDTSRLSEAMHLAFFAVYGFCVSCLAVGLHAIVDCIILLTLRARRGLSKFSGRLPAYVTSSVVYTALYLKSPLSAEESVVRKIARALKKCWSLVVTRAVRVCYVCLLYLYEGRGPYPPVDEGKEPIGRAIED